MLNHAIIAAALVLLSASASADVTGNARVIGGNVIEVGSELVRPHGIDAPETSHTCTTVGKE